MSINSWGKISEKEKYSINSRFRLKKSAIIAIFFHSEQLIGLNKMCGKYKTSLN